MEQKKVLIPQDITQAGKDYLTNLGYEWRLGSGIEEEAICREIADCDALLIRTGKITGNMLRAGKKLKVIGRHGVGVDNIDLETATALGIQVTNSPLSNADAVAEHTVALILACGHHITQMDYHCRHGDWEQRNIMKLTQATGKTVGILGFGRIGQGVAQKCALGLSMNVIAYSRSLTQENCPDYVTAVSSMEKIFQNADYISLHLPMTEKTRGSINLSVFQQMKNTAFLINTSRGEVVQEADLYQALSTGLIQGAGIDVLETEPPQLDNPLFSLDNIIITPHCGAHTHAAFDNMGLHAAQGIHEVLSGQTPTWPVNKISS